MEAAATGCFSSDFTGNGLARGCRGLEFQDAVTCLQARSQAVEAQLVHTTKELQQLKARQAELELLLQKAHITQKQPVSSAKIYAFAHAVSLAQWSLHVHTFTA